MTAGGAARPGVKRGLWLPGTLPNYSSMAVPGASAQRWSGVAGVPEVAGDSARREAGEALAAPRWSEVRCRARAEQLGRP